MVKTAEKKDYLNTLANVHLPRWNELPDMDLYKDQVVSLILRYLSAFSEEGMDIITPSMINNYVKWKVVPAPSRRKQYGRPQLAGLIIVSLLKQVVSIADIKAGMESQQALSGDEKAYDSFCDSFEQCASFAASKMKLADSRANLRVNADSRMTMSACLSCVFRLCALKQAEDQRQLIAKTKKDDGR